MIDAGWLLPAYVLGLCAGYFLGLCAGYFLRATTREWADRG